MNVTPITYLITNLIEKELNELNNLNNYNKTDPQFLFNCHLFLNFPTKNYFFFF